MRTISLYHHNESEKDLVGIQGSLIEENGKFFIAFFTGERMSDDIHKVEISLEKAQEIYLCSFYGVHEIYCGRIDELLFADEDEVEEAFERIDA